MPKKNPDDIQYFGAFQQEVTEQIGGRIRSRRISLRITQEQVRARLEVARTPISRTRYSRIEAGRSTPSAVEIIGLSEALLVSAGFLLIGREY